MAQIVRPVQPPFLKMNFVQRFIALPLQNPHSLRLGGITPRQETHIICDFIPRMGGKIPLAILAKPCYTEITDDSLLQTEYVR